MAKINTEDQKIRRKHAKIEDKTLKTLMNGAKPSIEMLKVSIIPSKLKGKTQLIRSNYKKILQNEPFKLKTKGKNSRI